MTDRLTIALAQMNQKVGDLADWIETRMPGIAAQRELRGADGN